MVKILTDTSTLFSVAEGKEIGLTVVPLSVSLHDKTYREFEDIDTARFLDMLKDGSIPSSSQPSLGEIIDAYKSLDGHEVINITIADGLSGTYRTAEQAKTMVSNEEDITVINSGTLCGPHRYVVQWALRMAEAGRQAKDIIDEVTEKLKHQVSFLMPMDFNFLRRGGRITPLAAAMGSILRFVPVLTQTVDGKRLERAGLSRNFAHALKVVLDKLAAMGAGEGTLISVSHAGNPDKGDKAVQAVKERFPGAQVEFLTLSPAFVVQGGPGCIAVQMIRK